MRLEFTPSRPPCRDCNQSKHNQRIRLQVGLVPSYKSRETTFEAPHRNWLTSMDPSNGANKVGLTRRCCCETVDRCARNSLLKRVTNLPF